MKRVVFILLLVGIPVLSFGQISEIGGGIGALSYTGDLHRGYKFLKNRPAATAHIRTNINDFVSLKGGITFGRLIGSDDPPYDVFATNRNASFRLFMVELSGVIEYSFLNYRGTNSTYRWSPYFFAGVGLFTFFGEDDRTETYSNVQPAIPVGFGIKYVYNPRWIIGFKFGARHTFFDYLDNISDGNRTQKNYQYGNAFNNDMYYFIGITLDYSFFRIPCPYPYHKTYRGQK